MLIGPNTDPTPFAALAEAAHAGRAHRCELPCTSAAGRTFWVGIYLMPVPEWSNQFLALGEDVTAAVEARIQQAATQSLLAQVFLSIDSAVAIASQDGRLLMTNPFTDRLLGHQPRSLAGRSALDLVAPEAYEAAFAAWERQVADGADVSLDLPLVRADGVHVPVAMRVSVVETPDRRRFRIITARPSPVPTSREIAGRRVLASRIRLAGIDAASTSLGERWAATAERAAVLDTAGRDLSAHAAALEDAARANLRTLLAGLTAATEPIHRLDGAWGAFVAPTTDDERRIQTALAALPMAEAQELDLDARLLDLACDRLADPDLPPGHRLVVPVSFDLFDHRPALDRYVTAGRLLDRTVRPRLVLVLTGMPATTPRARLMDCIIRLRPYCGMIALEVDGPDTVPPDLSLCGAPLVAMDAAAVDPPRLAELLAQLRMSRTQLLIRRAGTMAEAKALLAAGVDLVSVRPPETVQ